MAPVSGMLGNSAGKGDRHPVRKRDIAGYMLLPKVLPRLAELFFTGFNFFAFFMAQVYRSVRLLPADHPSLNPANVGQYGIRDIIGEAYRHLVWKRENIDQIVVFIAILLGLVILVAQAATFVVALAMPQAVAATFGFSSIFGTPYGGGTQDIAFILLDRVFGVPGIFNSCISSISVPCAGVDPVTMKFDMAHPVYKPAGFPWPFHKGLQAMFQFYSIGLLLVGIFILLYYVIVIVAETAQTGTPFGKRFNTVWAPLRLVMAFGLLIPISNGLNSAQYITLYAAKWGSNFATNGWILFNNAIQNKASGMTMGMDMAVKPKEPDVAGLMQFMSLAHTCKAFEETTMIPPDPRGAAPAQAATPAPAANGAAATVAAPACPSAAKGVNIEAYLVKPGYEADKSAKRLSEFANYQAALAWAENGSIQIRFGDLTCDGAQAKGNVVPTCGEITLPTNSPTDKAALTIQEGYFNLVKYLWGNYTGSYENTAINASPQSDKRPQVKACKPSEYNKILGNGGDLTFRQNALEEFQLTQCDLRTHADYDIIPAPPAEWKDAAVQNYTYGNDPVDTESDIAQQVGAYPGYNNIDSSVIVRNIIKKGVMALRTQAAGGYYNVADDNLRRGWAIAGIWYNKIAEANGSLIGAAWDIPAPDMYPQMMMTVVNLKRQENVSTSPEDMFCPNNSRDSMNLPGGDASKAYASTMCRSYKDWNTRGRKVKPTGNAMADFVNLIFGTQGLFDLRYEQNNRAHPLAMLVGVGKGLIEASIRNLGIGMGSGLLSVVSGLLGSGSGIELTTAISSFFFSIATMTLTAGFILFYVVPFLPFLYFFFAVGNWLKGVFEAMVGVPLWALAHLRIDGHGLPGEGAMNGYFMLFEIFLRPILILFGFLASISIFAAMASVLHEVFEVAVTNLTGAGAGSQGNAIDRFFYTIMYAVIMYIMALSSFKLIDLIPKQLMRWMGTSVSTFSDLNEDAAGNLTNMTAIAGSQVVGGMTTGLQGGMQAVAKGAQGLNQGARGIMAQGANAGKPV